MRDIMAETRIATAAAGGASIPAPSAAALRNQGLAAGLAAFVIWGMFPIYLAGLHSVSALQVTAHRVAWSCVFVVALLAARRELNDVWAAVAREGVLIRLAASA